MSLVSFRRKNAICVSFMYSSSGMAIRSASESWSTGLSFQLLASFGSFLTAEASGGTIIGTDWVCMKLALAAVDATDCAMEGTVNCARREDGRPALAGIDAVATGMGSGTALADTAAAFATVPGVTECVTLGFDTASDLPAFAVIIFSESFTLSLTFAFDPVSMSRTDTFGEDLTGNAFFTGDVTDAPAPVLPPAIGAGLPPGATLATGFAVDLPAGLGLTTAWITWGSTLAFAD